MCTPWGASPYRRTFWDVARGKAWAQAGSPTAGGGAAGKKRKKHARVLGSTARAGTMGSFKLEKFKFLVYLIAPMIAVAVYSRPTVHETSLNYHRYVVYPAPEKKLVMRQPAPPPEKVQ